MLEVALTAAAVVLALTQPVPQIVRLVRTRSVAGVSAPTAWIGIAGNLAWVAYGIARGLLPVAVLSVAYLIGYVLIAGLLVRGGNRRGVGTGIGFVVAAAVVTVVGGWTLLGTALALTTLVQYSPQVVTAWRSSDLTALSPGMYVVCLLDGLVWGGYGALTGDGPLVLYGVIMVSVAVLVLVPTRRWKAALAV